MEDSLKGVLITLTIAGLFIIGILNFIVIFPQEQGVVFNDASSQTGYLVINQTANNAQSSPSSNLEAMNNATSSGFDQWDITQGFMGSNTIKQSSGTGVQGYSTNIFNTLLVIGKQIFGSGSPVIYVLLTLMSLTLGYLIYVVIKFIRTGN